MKGIIVALIALMLFAKPVFAEWNVDFEETYSKKGIDQAVVDALKEGILPDSIVERGLTLEGLNPQNLIMALYCAGVNGQEIRQAAEAHNISDMIVTAGYKKSVVECGDAVADSQAYTPFSGGFPGVQGGAPSGSSDASLSTFQ